MQSVAWAVGNSSQSLPPVVCLSLLSTFLLASLQWAALGCWGLPVHEFRGVLFPQSPCAWTVSGGCLLLLCVVSPKPQRNYVNICAELWKQS